MKKFLRWLDINFEPLCMTVMFYLMSGLMVLQVILRFAFHTGFAWGEEVSRFIFVWLVFLSLDLLKQGNVERILELLHFSRRLIS